MREKKLPVLTGLIVDETTTLTVDELSSVCAVHVEQIIALVDEGILEPEGRNVSEWQFSGSSLNRVLTAIRLQQDLDINLAGVALVLDLMEELESLRAQLQDME